MRKAVIVVVSVLPLIMVAFSPEAARTSNTYAATVANIVAALSALQVLLATLCAALSLRTGTSVSDEATADRGWRSRLPKFYRDLLLLFVIPFLIFCVSFGVFHARFAPGLADSGQLIAGAIVFLAGIVLVNVLAFMCGIRFGRRKLRCRYEILAPGRA